jgi:putative transcriptional regulator
MMKGVRYLLKNNVRRLRFTNGEMTQQALADALGVSRQTVYSVETGKFNPSVKLALKISSVFRVGVEEAFYLEGDDV